MRQWRMENKLAGFLVAVFALTILLSDEIDGQRIGPAGELGDDLWQTNQYIQDMNKMAKIANKTNCWLCMHLPGQAGGGLLLHGIPFNVTGFMTYALHTGTVPKVTVRTRIALRETAFLCIKRKDGTENLGAYTNCRLTRLWNGTRQGCNGWRDLMTLQGNTYKNNENMTATEYAMCLVMDDVRRQGDYCMTGNMWLLCGQFAYRNIPQNWTGTCTFGIVVPTFYYLPVLPQTRIRNRREEVTNELTLGGSLRTQISRALIPAIGVAMNYRDLHILNNWTVAMFNQTIGALKLVNKELDEVRTVALQNRYALDVTLAAKGGVCALIHSHCCVFIHDYKVNISHTVATMESMIRSNPLQGLGSAAVDIWGALWSWLPDGSWIRGLIMTVIIFVVILITFCCCLQCLPSLCSTMKGFFSKCKTTDIHHTESSAIPLSKRRKEEMWE